MKLPLSGPAHTLDALASWVRSLASAVAAGFHVEHGADGTHTFPWSVDAVNVARFTGSGTMTWTVAGADVVLLRYSRVAKTLDVAFDIRGTVGGAVNTTLFITLPGRHLVTTDGVAGVFAYNDAGGAGTGLATTRGHQLFLVKSLLVPNWAAGAVRVVGSVRLEVL